VSEVPLPSLGATLGAALLALPFLVLALRNAARVLPRRPAPLGGFSGGEVLAIVATPFALLVILGSLAGAEVPDPARVPTGREVVLGIVGTQLVLGTAGALALVLARRHAEGRRLLGLGAPFPVATLALVPAVFLPGFFVLHVGANSLWLRVCRLAGWEERQEILQHLQGLSGGQLWVAGVLAVLVGPFVEELLFRGFLQGQLERVLGARGGLVLTSLLFARLHGMAGLPVLFGLSLFLGWLQQRSRCLAVPWCAHALNNAVSLGLAFTLLPQ